MSRFHISGYYFVLDRKFSIIKQRIIIDSQCSHSLCFYFVLEPFISEVPEGYDTSRFSLSLFSCPLQGYINLPNLFEEIFKFTVRLTDDLSGRFAIKVY